MSGPKKILWKYYVMRVTKDNKQPYQLMGCGGYKHAPMKGLHLLEFNGHVRGKQPAAPAHGAETALTWLSPPADVWVFIASYGTDENLAVQSLRCFAKNMFNKEAKDGCQQMLSYIPDSSWVDGKRPKASKIA